MFLQILGVIFLLVLCVVAFLGWKFYRMVKIQSNSDVAIAMTLLPSQYVDLEPSNAEEWQEKERLHFSESELKKIGAAHIGYYCVYHGDAVIRISLWDFKGQAVAALYEGFSALDNNNTNYIFELACKLDDGSLCISSNPHVLNDIRPECHLIQHNSSNSIIDFVKSMKGAIPEGRKLLKIKHPKAFFMECCEDIAVFAWQEEQLRSSNTQQALTAVGVKVNEELMEHLVDMGKHFAVELYVERARKRVAQHSKISAGKWEEIRNQLVVVNEIMQTEDLVNAVYELAGELTESQQQALDGFEKTNKELSDPIAAFQLLIQALHLNVKKLTTLDKPVKTDIYLPLH